MHMQKCIVMWKSVLMYKACINSATSFPSHLTPFLVGIGSDNYHLLLSPFMLHACRWSACLQMVCNVILVFYWVRTFQAFSTSNLGRFYQKLLHAQSTKQVYRHCSWIGDWFADAYQYTVYLFSKWQVLLFGGRLGRQLTTVLTPLAGGC